MEKLYGPQHFNVGDKVYISYVYGKTRTNSLIDTSKSGIYIAEITKITSDFVMVRYIYGGTHLPVKFYFETDDSDYSSDEYYLMHGFIYSAKLNLFMTKTVDDAIAAYNKLIDKLYKYKSNELYRNYLRCRKTYPGDCNMRNILEKL